jgi:methionyl-tRNA synthetase
LQEGLHDRAATRDLAWGIDVSIEGFEGKKIYVWIEAVLGYVSASKIWAEDNGGAWEKFWSAATTAYYVHGKDNIPFHTIILPALLLGIGGLHLPDRILSSEYLTLEGAKFSTSRNWAVWVPCMLERYHPDSIRYFLTINGPEQRDADFSWREFIHSHNGELLGAFGNFVQRNLVFVQKSFAGTVPVSEMDEEVRRNIESLYDRVGCWSLSSLLPVQKSAHCLIFRQRAGNISRFAAGKSSRLLSICSNGSMSPGFKKRLRG